MREKVITNLFPLFFDLRLNFALWRGWKLTSLKLHQTRWRVIVVAKLEK